MCLFYDCITSHYHICGYFGNFFFKIDYKLQDMERINQRTNHLVGTNIRKMRIERKMRSVDVVAKLQLDGIEITTSTFCKVERGTNNPSVDLLIALTDIFHCDFNAFFKQ